MSVRIPKLRLQGIVTALFAALLAVNGLPDGPPTQALPVFARRYGVTCDTCHSVVPRLNDYGLAFQANHFAWPDGTPPRGRGWTAAVPISALATWSRFDDITAHTASSRFDTLELFAAGAFPFFGGPDAAQGGYFVDYFADVNGGLAGDLEDSFVTLPVAGHGAVDVTGGQFAPMSYQYDPLNSLSRTLPAGLDGSANGFSFLSPGPGVRLDFHDHPGNDDASGNYVDVGFPFEGHLALDDTSSWYGSHGAYVHAFRRSGGVTGGLFDYQNTHDYVQGLLATWQPTPQLGFLTAASVSHVVAGATDACSLEGDYTLDPFVGFTARLESVAGDQQQTAVYPVESITFSPDRQNYVRLVGEAVQNSSQRSAALYVYVQL
ncbi:MAG: hypothetical protein ACLQVD_11975 [Capsulimonadaceae bacterium]